MGFHHVALATHDTEATHDFYTNVMGFELVKVVAGPTPGDHGGWSKHFFYSTAGAAGPSSDNGLIAFWEIHDPVIGNDFPVDLNKPFGLPGWVNHIAFDAPTIDDLHRHRERWRGHGHHVMEVDHHFCVSIYIRDPSGNTVEFCHTTRQFTAAETAEAQLHLHDPQPPFGPEPIVTIHKPIAASAPSSANSPTPDPIGV